MRLIPAVAALAFVSGVGLELAGPTRQEFVLGIDQLKRPTSALQKRMDYIYKVNDRWQKPSSTS